MVFWQKPKLGGWLPCYRSDKGRPWGWGWPQWGWGWPAQPGFDLNSFLSNHPRSSFLPPTSFHAFFFVILLRFRNDTTKSNELTWTLSLLPHDDCNIRLPQAKRSFIIWDNEPRPGPLKWGMWKKLMWENEEMRGELFGIWEAGDKGENQDEASPFLLFKLMLVSVGWWEMT